MNILHVNDKVEILGGVEVYIEDLCKNFPDYGLSSKWLGIQTNHSNFTVKEYGKREGLNELTFRELILFVNKFVKINKIDLIHVHSLSEPKLIQELFKIRPVVRTMHEPRMFCPGQGKFWRKSETICNKPFGIHCIYHTYKEGCCNRHPKRLFKAYRNVSFETNSGDNGYKAIFAMSEYMIEEAIKAGFDKNKLIFNPPFTTIEVTHNNCISESEEISLLFVGRLSRTKGVHYFIKMGIELLTRGHKIRLDIVGDGHDKELFINMVPNNLQKFFIFHGWKSRNEISQIYNNSYLLVFPSIYPEAFGITGIEAMMKSKPVVGFDVGGVSTWLKNEETGYLIKAKDTSSLIDKVEMLIMNKNVYSEFSTNARKFAIDNFSPEVSIGKLSEVYSSILQ